MRKQGIAKFTAFVLASGLALCDGGVVVFAAGADTALVGFHSAVSTGSALADHKGNENASEDIGETEAATDPQAAAVEAAEAETTDAESAEKEAAGTSVQDNTSADQDKTHDHSAEEGAEELDTSMVGTTGFAQCEEYLNVRAEAGTEGEVVGKIYNNGSLKILGVAPNGWYQVQSGNVSGYVSPDFVAIGEEASSIAASTGYTTAEVGAEVLNVRASASTDSDIIATVDNDNVIEVVEDQGDWVKVILDGEMYGYVSADYVYTSTEYATGETLEEEQARLDQEWLDYLAEQEAKQAAAEAAYLAAIAAQQAQATVAAPVYTEPAAQETYTETYTAPAAATDTSELNSQCDSAYQTYLDAQAAADAAVSDGMDEQTIIDTAAAAQDAYASYLSLQNQVDAAAAGLTTDTTTGSSEEAASTVTETVQTADTTPVTTEETAPAQVTAAVESTPETSAPAESSSVSSTGQAIANFATQFVGNPYVYGGSSLTNGADCSGFTMAVMSNFGIGLPHNAAAQSGCGTPVSLDSLQPGDLLFYEGSGGIGHVSIYIGGGQVVHASNPTNGILISSIGYRTPVSARRFV